MINTPWGFRFAVFANGVKESSTDHRPGFLYQDAIKIDYASVISIIICSAFFAFSMTHV